MAAVAFWDAQLHEISDLRKSLGNITEAVFVELRDTFLLIGDTAIIWGTDERPVCGYIVEDNTEILINVGFPNPGLRQQSVMFKGLNGGRYNADSPS